MRIHWPRFLYITPMTTYITTAQANEIGGVSLVFTFPLDGIKRFHHWIGKFGSFYVGFYIFGVGLHLDFN
jgi:hypothetical protein